MNAARRLYFDRLRELTAAEWRLREQSTMFGFLWTLLHPCLMFIVLYGLFTKWMGHRVADYPAYLVIGIIQYGFFNNATTYGLDSLRRRSGLLLNFTVEREIIVFSAVLSVAASFLIETAVMLAFAALTGVKPGAAWLAVPVVALVETLLVCGLCLFLSLAAARWHDFPRIWGILTTAGFFLTPIFYSLDTLSADRQRLLWLNPMTHVIEISRACVLGGRWPAFSALAVMTLGGLALLAAGLFLFRSQQRKLADFVG